jgi:hypothetical protein
VVLQKRVVSRASTLSLALIKLARAKDALLHEASSRNASESAIIDGTLITVENKRRYPLYLLKGLYMKKLALSIATTSLLVGFAAIPSFVNRTD